MYGSPSIALWWLASTWAIHELTELERKKERTWHNIFPHFSGMVRMSILTQVSRQHFCKLTGRSSASLPRRIQKMTHTRIAGFN